MQLSFLTLTKSLLAGALLCGVVKTRAQVLPHAISLHYWNANGELVEREMSVTVTVNSTAAEYVQRVDYRVEPGTAADGLDLVAISGTLTFLPGETTKTISIPLLDDSEIETTEDFSI